MHDAPKFSLPDQNGTLRTLSDFAGSWLVLYFYPKDDTPVCTKEACSFRDNTAEFQKRGIQVVGVSKDSVASHKKFAEKYQLNFPLLSDTALSMIKAYNAWGEKKFMGRTFAGVLRKTYLINPKGEVVKVYEKVNPLVHAGEILSDIVASR